MRINRLRSRLAASLALIVGPCVHAGENVQPTAIITGRVSNAATGMYLNNARVSIVGTDRVAFTDASGTYRLVNVPSGPIVVTVFYTDLDQQELTLQIPPGGKIERDISLTSKSRYGEARRRRSR